MVKRVSTRNSTYGIVTIQDKELRNILEKLNNAQLRNIADWIEMRRRFMPQ